MGTRSKEQKEQVNQKHCCVCFKLRTSILLSICISIILIIVYGYKYWISASSREDYPNKFYGYIAVVGVEFLFSIFGWIGIYNHIYVFTKYFTYWVIIHILIIVIVFWVSTLFDYLHFGFFIAWIVIQILLLILLWKFKQVLKMVYGWGEDEDSKEEEEEPEEIETEPIAPPPVEEPKKDANNVNVSINLTMPQQPTMYQQHQQLNQPIQQRPMMPYNNMAQQMQPMQPQQMMYGQQQQYPSLPHIANNLSSPEALKAMQNNPPNAPYGQQQQIIANNTQKMSNLSDVAQQADPPQIVNNNNNDDDSTSNSDTDPNGQVRISVYSNNDATKTDYDEENVFHQNGNNMVMADKQQNDAAEAQIYDTSKWQQTGGNTEGMNEGYETNTVQIDQQLNRIKTPDPPPPPNNKMISNESDNDVLSDDFIADVQPNPHRQQTQGVNLYFLDPGDNKTKGYK